MILEELLDELRDNILRDNAELASGPNDQLWTDETLVRYLNDAQRRFARKTLTLRDSSTAQVVEVPLATGVSSYTLHKSVRAVVSAKYGTERLDLTRVGHRLIAEASSPEAPTFDVNSTSTLTPGRPLAFATDEALDIPEDSAVVLTVYPAPTAEENGDIIYLRVARTPINDLDVADVEGAPEIASEYHLDLCEWAAYRCLRNSDIDGHSDRAVKHEKRFNDAMAEALKEREQKQHAPMAWDIGGHGFSWR